VVGLAAAAAAFATGRDFVALAAAVGASVPAIVTAVAARFPKLVRLRPAEVAAAVAGIVAAIILYAGDRDLAALVSGAFALLPALATGLVTVQDPSK
jgi:hypothetical protein